MLDFEQELNKLLREESAAEGISELGSLAEEGSRIITAFDKKQTDMSLQIEEIYDILQDSGETQKTLREALKLENERVTQLLSTAVGLSDIVEDFCAFALESGGEELAAQARIMLKNTDTLLSECGIARLGEAGQWLDPSLHSVQSAAASPYPREQIARVLRSGYRYVGSVVRKAVVVVSLGQEENLT